jgi:hypothetical protein
MKNKIKVNKIQCAKCKDIIESKHRHDFKFCSCGAVAVDGGKDYLKRCFDCEESVIELSECEDEK